MAKAMLVISPCLIFNIYVKFARVTHQDRDTPFVGLLLCSMALNNALNLIEFSKPGLEKVIVTTDTLHIRNPGISDLNDFHILSKHGVTKYQGFDVMTIKQTDEFICEQNDKLSGQPGEWFQYGIETNQHTKSLAIVLLRLTNIKGESPKIGISIILF